MENQMIIFQDKDSDRFICDLTKEMDLYSLSTFKYWYTYLLKSNDNTYGIRFPGASRGHIEVDSEGIIRNIKLYPEVDSIYKKEVYNIFNKYIGLRLVPKYNIKGD